MSAACGSESTRYMPLAVGNTWTYLVDDGVNPPVGKTTTLEAVEAVPDKPSVMAFRQRTEKAKGHTLSWLEDAGDRVLRHYDENYDETGMQTSHETYDPSKLRVDETAEHLVVGATWVDAYTDTNVDANGTVPVQKVETWTVVAVDEIVTVPAGDIPCLKLERKGNMANQPLKTFWFARGVGKVKETSEGANPDVRSEELQSCAAQ